MIRTSLFLILSFFIVFNTVAQAADLYTVQHVKVDEKDESAAKAKIKALAAGQKKAFDTLLSRLVQEEYRQQIPEFDNKFISRYFAGLSVEEEKTSSTRYIATLTYRFKTKEVRDMLLSYGVPFEENRAESILIVPVWLEGGRNILFEDKNPWRDAWLKVDASNSVTPVLVPLGDTADREALTAQQALKLDQASFEKLKERYSVSHIVVAAARPNPGGASLNVYVRGQTSSGNINIEDAVAGKAGEMDDLALKAANSLLAQIQKQYKRTRATQGQQADNLVSVSVPFNSFQEWSYINTRIKNTESVQAVEIRQLSSQTALIDIIFSGDIAGLNKKLSREKLVLVDDGVNWTIRRLGEGATSLPQTPQPSFQQTPQQEPPTTGQQPYVRPAAPQSDIEVKQLPPAN